MKSSIARFANLMGETGLYRSMFSQHLPVFMLHRISDDRVEIPGAVHTDTLRSYLEYLAAHGYQVLTMVQLWHFLAEDKPISSKSVMFTIDDGFFDHHDAAAKVFDEFGFPLNVFVITDFLDQKLWPWDDQVAYAIERSTVKNVAIELPSGDWYELDISKDSCKETVRSVRNILKSIDQAGLYEWVKDELYPKLEVEFPSAAPERYRAMSWDHARSLIRRGHGVFPHTCSHRILSSLPADQKRREILESALTIERELGDFPAVFAYPTGRPTDYDSSDIEVLQSIGVRMAFTTVAKYVEAGPNTDLFSIPRFSLPETTSEFLQIVNRFQAVKDALMHR